MSKKTDEIIKRNEETLDAMRSKLEACAERLIDAVHSLKIEACDKIPDSSGCILYPAEDAIIVEYADECHLQVSWDQFWTLFCEGEEYAWDTKRIREMAKKLVQIADAIDEVPDEQLFNGESLVAKIIKGKC